MKQLLRLPEPQAVSLDVVEDCSPDGDGFLRYVSRRLVAVLAGGQLSREFVYDEVDRRCLDAVIVVPYFFAAVGETTSAWVVLRSAVRPPVALRDEKRSPIEEPTNRTLWEFPAGLIEPDELSAAGIRSAARRELQEEAGFMVREDALHQLGPSAFPCPGMAGERHFFFAVEVDPAQRIEPSLDGSVLEELGEVVAIPLSEAFEAARAGRLTDSKTELSLYRLSDMLQRQVGS